MARVTTAELQKEALKEQMHLIKGQTRALVFAAIYGAGPEVIKQNHEQLQSSYRIMENLIEHRSV